MNTVEPTCFAPYIQDAGYHTFYAGKYLNEYGTHQETLDHVPKGWDEWRGLMKNSRYYNVTISNNGVTEEYGDDYNAGDYYTEIITRQSLEFLRSDHSNRPFFMVLATPAAHAPWTPPPQYNFTNLTAVRSPHWNMTEGIDTTKHVVMKDIKPLNDEVVGILDFIYSQRAGTLKSVDDMVEAVYSEIASMNLLNDTIFLLTSDHGYHLGQFGMGWDKRQLYEFDIRVPFVVMGPGIPRNATTKKIAVSIDIAPTLIEWATGNTEAVPDEMDGHSLAQWMKNPLENRMVNPEANYSQQFLVEYYGGIGHEICPGRFEHVISGWSNQCDGANNTYHCVRAISGEQRNGSIYCKFSCYSEDSKPGNRKQVECEDDGSAQFYGEHYNLDIDPYQLNNTMLTLDEEQKMWFEDMLIQLMECEGNTECDALRFQDGNGFEDFYIDLDVTTNGSFMVLEGSDMVVVGSNKEEYVRWIMRMWIIIGIIIGGIWIWCSGIMLRVYVLKQRKRKRTGQKQDALSSKDQMNGATKEGQGAEMGTTANIEGMCVVGMQPVAIVPIR